MKNERRQLIWSAQFKIVQAMKILMVLSGAWLFPAIGFDTELLWLFAILGVASLIASFAMALAAYTELSRKPDKSVSRWMVCAKE
jgi:hypothetical protein